MPNRTTQGRKCPSKLLRFASPLLFPGEKPTRRDRWLAVTSQLFFAAGTNDYWEGEEREKIEQRRIALPPLPNSQKYWQKYSNIQLPPWYGHRFSTTARTSNRWRIPYLTWPNIPLRGVKRYEYSIRVIHVWITTAYLYVYSISMAAATEAACQINSEYLISRVTYIYIYNRNERSSKGIVIEVTERFI